MLDPQVSLYFSRDLDSQLGERELAAVTEFVNFTEASVSLLVLTSISNCRVTNIPSDQHLIQSCKGDTYVKVCYIHASQTREIVL